MLSKTHLFYWLFVIISDMDSYSTLITPNPPWRDIKAFLRLSGFSEVTTVTDLGQCILRLYAFLVSPGTPGNNAASI